MSAITTPTAPNQALLDSDCEGTPASRDRLRDENAELINRLELLQRTLEGIVADNAAARRQLARLRAENRALRAALAGRNPAMSMRFSAS